jgi:hypothetical protein
MPFIHDPLELERINWALTEDVWVTLVSSEPDAVRNVYLVSRKNRPRFAPSHPADTAFVMDFRETQVFINGDEIDLGDALPQFCGLADSVLMADPTPGNFVATYADYDEFDANEPGPNYNR